ncbi:tRNA lysidine(34) synthetase TilS [bacterium]|nr:tRNA lysidine(34) synthetase TilS [bacterium]
MDDLLSIVEDFFVKHNLTTEKKIGVGFSGGYDSMCLLDVTSKLSEKYGFEVFALHLNHNWRGEESLSEAKRCENFCNNKKIKFYFETLSADCIKTETAAREYRYEFFEKCIEKFALDYILTAHNANDNAETVLYRAIKGSGIKGLGGIKEVREKFLRPLLNIKRENIEAYCKENSLIPNVDSSNFDTKYKRNFIRKEILPSLEQINPNIINALNTLSLTAQNDNLIIEEYLQKIYETLKIENEFSTQKFLTLSNFVQNRVIYDLLIQNSIDYDYKTVEKLVNFIKNNAKSTSVKKTSLNSEKFLAVNKEKFIVINSSKVTILPVIIEKCGRYDFGNYEFEISKCENMPEEFPLDCEYTAYCTICEEEFPFTLRLRADGDYIQPLGLSGRQKFKKYLIGKKIPQYKRDDIVLLTKEKEVLWAAGLGLSERIKAVSPPVYKLKLVKK